MQFKDLPTGQTFHFFDDRLNWDHVKVSEDWAERNGIKIKVNPDTYIQQWFIVFDPSCNVYVEAIYFDGEINMTPDRSLARLFRGDAWEQFWQGRGCNLKKVTGTGQPILQQQKQSQIG